MENLILENTRPDITFRPSGLITLSSKVVRLLGIDAGDVINIMHGDGEYYLYIQYKAPLGTFSGRCLKHKNGSHHMRVYFKKMASAIIAQSGKAEAHYRIGEPLYLNGDMCLPIITKLNLYKER